MGSDWFYLVREYVVPVIWVQTGFYLAKEYVVSIIWVQTVFILQESMWCL